MIYRCCSFINGLSGSFAVNLAVSGLKNTNGKLEGSLPIEQAKGVCFAVSRDLNEVFPDCLKKSSLKINMLDLVS